MSSLVVSAWIGAFAGGLGGRLDGRRQIGRSRHVEQDVEGALLNAPLASAEKFAAEMPSLA
jgi:hypothetical protein